MELCLVGNTGSGKSTLARALGDRLHVPVISTGEIARRIALDDPHARLMLEKGMLAPEEAIRSEVRRLLEQAQLEGSGYVLDGFPRFNAQLFALMQWTRRLPAFLYVQVPVVVCVERLIERGRSDDAPDAIERKLEHFSSKTLPMLDLIEDVGGLHTVNGDAPTDRILRLIEEQLVA